MRRQNHDPREMAYERPQMPFVCGLAAEGIHCPLGPCGKKCSAGTECNPIKDGDRWLCGRPISAGGACEQGPGPDGACCHPLHCTPVPSARTKRGRWIAASVLFTAGLMLLMFGGPWRNEILAPGPLAQSHAQIIRREDASQRCASCHTAAGGGLKDWCLQGLGLASLGPTQSQLCLKCHEKLIPPELALSPHSLPLELLNVRTQRAVEQGRGGGEVNRAGLSFDLSTKRNELQCATCHREHHGPKHDLTLLTSAQCNTCHERSIVSLAHGHPEFSPSFAQPQSQIAFSHHSHRDKYFAEAKRDFKCNDCHLDSATGTKPTAPFALACASCHEPKIRTSTLEGLTFLQLPTIDIAAIQAAGEEVPDWPAAADGDFDGRLPWPMRLLLAADPELAAPLATLGPDGDFADLNPDNAEHVKAAAILARGIAQLWTDLATRGPLAIEDRVASLLPEKSSLALPALTGGLSPDTLNAAVGQVFNLPEAEKTARLNREFIRRILQEDDLLTEEPQPANPFRKPPPQPAPSPPADEELLDTPKKIPEPAVDEPKPAEPSPLVPAPRRSPLLDAWKTDPLHRGTWFADEATLSLRYIPTGHADAVLTAWITATVSQRESTSRPERGAVMRQATNEKSAGLCAQCHRPEPHGGDSFAIAWRPESQPRRGFTKFSHRPHLIQPQLADCTHCHSFRSDGPATGFVAHHPGRSDFEPLTKRSCVNCHRAGAAGETCLQCHRYHVDAAALK